MVLSFAKSPDLDAKAAIVHVAADCMALASALTAQPLENDIQNTLGTSDVARTLSEVQSARSTMLKACDLKTLDQVLTAPEVREAVLAAKAAPARKLRFDQKSDSPAEYEQSVMVALSNPEKNPLAFDIWLEFGLKRVFPDAAEFSPVEFQYLQNMLYSRFAGSVPSDSWRSVSRCAIRYACHPEVELTSEQRAAMDKRALDIEALIRRQQWHTLGVR